MNKTLGILGGMGPQATVDLFDKIVKLTPADKDQDHIHIVIDNYPRIPDRTAFILGGGDNPVPYLLDSAKRLENAGVDAILMPCNTAHYFIPELAPHTGIPFISIVDSAIAELKAGYSDAKNILPLSTTGTKASGIYENALINAGYRVADLPDELAKAMMYVIYEGVKKGKTAEVAELFQNTLDKIKSLGPDVLIAACTEIPVILPYVNSPLPVIDATEALALAGVRFASSA